MSRQRVVCTGAGHAEEELFWSFEADVGVKSKGEIRVGVIPRTSSGITDVAVLGVVLRDVGLLLPQMPHPGLGFPVGAVAAGDEDAGIDAESLADPVEFAAGVLHSALAVVNAPRLVGEDDHVGVEAELLELIGSARMEQNPITRVARCLATRSRSNDGPV